MNVDTMRPADKVWCMLHPLAGNAAGSSTLFLKKTAITIGSETKSDVILRHQKILAHHCTIVSGGWTRQTGFTGLLYLKGQRALRFRDQSIIYILQDENGSLSVSRCLTNRFYRFQGRIPRTPRQ